MQKDEITNMLKILKNYKEYIVCDTESTGFYVKPENDSYIKLIEIAAVKVRDGKVVDTFQQFINPQIKIPAKIVELTGITDEKVQHAPTYAAVIEMFYKFCNEDTLPLVFHNASHDLNFLNHFGQKANGYHFGSKTVDTLKLSRYYLSTRKKHSLESLCRDYGISDENHHEALNDAIVTNEFLNVLLKMTQVKKDMEKLTNSSCDELSLFDIEAEKQVADYKINKVSYWEKEFKNKMIKRIYVSISNEKDKANVFYDFDKKDWGVKDSSFKEMINTCNVKKKILNEYEISEESFGDANYWKCIF